VFFLFSCTHLRRTVSMEEQELAEKIKADVKSRLLSHHRPSFGGGFGPEDTDSEDDSDVDSKERTGKKRPLGILERKEELLRRRRLREEDDAAREDMSEIGGSEKEEPDAQEATPQTTTTEGSTQLRVPGKGGEIGKETSTRKTDGRDWAKTLSLVEQVHLMMDDDGTNVERGCGYFGEGIGVGGVSEGVKPGDGRSAVADEVELTDFVPLLPAEELAKDIRYDDIIHTGWTVPSTLVPFLTPERVDLMRKMYHIHVEGLNIPPPLEAFRMMRIPQCLLEVFKAGGIQKPTPIQMQAIPVLFDGRDMIGVAFTGSGKTLAFCLPMMMMSLQQEIDMPILEGEGPFGLVLCPSRELARQTYEWVEQHCEVLHRAGFPLVRTLLVMGKIDMREQHHVLRRGVHIVIATPGRLKSMLEMHSINFRLCRYVCFDEADRMIDMGFEEDIRDILAYFKQRRQTVMFSATMPDKTSAFAKTAMQNPIVVNVGRAGAANLDVIQEVEYVKEEARMVYLLECFQKTPPPAIVFCERKSTVDDVHEYLLLKGISSVATHGDKDQKEREDAIRLFKAGESDVLVSNDIAAKGLDFPKVRHVVNYDMPRDIETYVHRIGRTGRCGKTGLATTFVNKSVPEFILLELKHVLLEAKQQVPPVLLTIEDPGEMVASAEGRKACAICSGLGHITAHCPYLQEERMRKVGMARESMQSGY
jgi:ATP-dependent RNA helicase DDX41